VSCEPCTCKKRNSHEAKLLSCRGRARSPGRPQPCPRRRQGAGARDPPLTQGQLDTHTEFFQYLVGIKVDGDEEKTFHRLVIEDWKTWDKAARSAFLEQLAEWKGMRTGRYEYRAKVLPSYLDRQGDPKKTTASEGWILEAYQTVYKKKADERPTVRMDKQPEPLSALKADYGFPDDPNHKHVFPVPIVFTAPHIYMKTDALRRYIDPVTRRVHNAHSYRWFLPTGRYYMRFVNEQVTEGWGRYTIDDKDRIQLESDKGEKLTLYLAWGREHVIWDGSVYSAPPKKK
jgi:hypothetical protein